MASILGPENLIITRLKTALSADTDVAVLPAIDMADVLKEKRQRKAVFVIYTPFRVQDSGPRSVALRSRWLVAVAVKASRGRETAIAARADADPILTTCIKALHDWQPETGYKKMLLDGDGGEAQRDGYFFQGLLFGVDFVITAGI